MVKDCVGEVTETTKVVPHFNSQEAVDDRFEKLDAKLDDLQRNFGHHGREKGNLLSRTDV